MSQETLVLRSPGAVEKGWRKPSDFTAPSAGFEERFEQSGPYYEERVSRETLVLRSPGAVEKGWRKPSDVTAPSAGFEERLEQSGPYYEKLVC